MMEISRAHPQAAKGAVSKAKKFRCDTPFVKFRAGDSRD